MTIEETQIVKQKAEDKINNLIDELRKIIGHTGPIQIMVVHSNLIAGDDHVLLKIFI